MYLKYAEIGESETSLDIVDFIVKKYKTNVDVMCLFNDIRKLYRTGDRKSILALKNFSQDYDMYESIVTRYGTRFNADAAVLRKVRPTLLNLAAEYVRILEGTTKEGRKKHLRVV